MTNVTIIPVYVPSYTVTAPTYMLSVGASGIVGSGGVTTEPDGVYSVINSGRIGTPATGTGVLTYRGGTVINDLGATIAAGTIGVSIGSGYETRGTHTSFGSVVNYGSIVGSTGEGVYLGDNLLQGVFVTNGGTGDAGALISGADGILDQVGLFASVDTTIRNFGTVQGTGGAGVKLIAGTRGTIVNGSSLDSHALITGFIGVDGTGDGAMVVQNFGTIEGTGGGAVLLGSPSDTLIVEAGATFIGTVDGTGGTLVAADAGAGTLTGLGTSFTSFNDVSVASGAAWTLTGVNSIAAGTVLTNNGSLRDAGTLMNSGTIALGEALQVAAGGSLINAGSIAGAAPGGVGVDLRDGGVIVNGVSGSTAASILGAQYGIFAVNGPTTLTNFGTILASDGGSGFYQGSGVATVFNAGVIGATNGSGVGIDLEGGGTIIDSGTFEGGNTAVRFGGTGSNLLVLENGYEFFGLIQGSASASNTLELVGSVDAPVTEKYLDQGVGLVDFQTVEFGPGAGNAATLGIGNDAELPATIAGFVGVHNTIDLTALSDTGNNATTSFNSLTDVLTVTGDNGSVQLQLDNNESYAGIDWVAQNDGNGGTAIQGVVQPVISGIVAGQTTTDEATDQPFAGVTITDANPSPEAETLTITLTDDGVATDANGTLSGTGLSKTGTGAYTLVASSAAAATADLKSLVFTPTAHQVAPGSSVTTTFTIQATDTAGGTSSNSTTTVGVTAVNDPPLITGTIADQTTTDGSAVTPFSGVSIGDVDFGQTETVTVTLSSAANGTLSNLGDGTFNSGTGVYTVTGTDTAVSAAVDGLVFAPAAHQVAPGSSVVTTFTISATDTSGATTSNSTTTVVATAVNDPPVITGTRAGQLISADQTDRPFAGVTISDPDVGASETVTITLTVDGMASDANGILSGAGLTKTGTGTYTLAAGTPAAATAALRALVFTSAALEWPSGSAAVTDMTLSVSVGAGSPATDTTTSVDIVPCFAAGTRIATPRGVTPVERLREGDIVLTVSGKPQPIQWIGCRTLDCTRHMSPKRVKPIRIAPHAFGENRPRRALLLSPDHSVFVEDVLIPVKHLVNGTTVTQIDLATVTYYHVELPRHDVVLAEGLPAETYLETGARFAFENGGGAMQLHPDFAPDEARVGMVWRNFSYAPLIGTDGQLDRVRARLALQALMLGQQADVASQPQKKRTRRS